MPVVPQADREARPLPTPIQGPENSGLTGLIVAHQTMVWRYLRLLGADLHEADDLMQDTFLLAAERLRCGAQLIEAAAFLRSVARNLLIGARRRARRRPSLVSWVDAVDRFVHAEPELLGDHRLSTMRACLGQLGGRMREAIDWHHVQGVSCKEAAVRMGIGLHGIKSLLSRARQALRDCVRNKMEEESSS